MDWDLEQRNQELETMLTVYQDHIEVLEAENLELKEKVEFLHLDNHDAYSKLAQVEREKKILPNCNRANK